MVQGASDVLLRGPLLRHVIERQATIWVDTDASCVVEVRAWDRVAEDRTFRLAGYDDTIVVDTKMPFIGRG